MTLWTRLLAGAVLAILLLGAGSHAVADVETGIDTGSADATVHVEPATDEFGASELLTLDFSAKRLLVSLGFVGALVARRQKQAA